MQWAMAFLLREQFVIRELAILPFDTVATSLLDPKRRVVLNREMSTKSNDQDCVSEASAHQDPVEQRNLPSTIHDFVMGGISPPEESVRTILSPISYGL